MLVTVPHYNYLLLLCLKEKSNAEIVESCRTLNLLGDVPYSELQKAKNSIRQPYKQWCGCNGLSDGWCNTTAYTKAVGILQSSIRHVIEILMLSGMRFNDIEATLQVHYNVNYSQYVLSVYYTYFWNLRNMQRHVLEQHITDKHPPEYLKSLFGGLIAALRILNIEINIPIQDAAAIVLQNMISDILDLSYLDALITQIALTPAEKLTLSFDRHNIAVKLYTAAARLIPAVTPTTKEEGTLLEFLSRLKQVKNIPKLNKSLEDLDGTFEK